MTPTATVQRSEHAIIAERREQEHYDLPLRSCLGSGCCPDCGRPLGDVAQVGGGTHDYHSLGRCED